MVPSRAAHRHDRQLAVERDERLEQARHLADRPPGVLGEQSVVDHRLPLAVVAEPAGLQHGGRAEPRERLVERCERVDRRVGRAPAGRLGEQLLLGEPILRRLERAGRREDRAQLLDESRRLDRHVLELVRHDVASAGELGERVAVVVGADDRRRDERRRRASGRVERDARDAEVVARRARACDRADRRR